MHESEQIHKPKSKDNVWFHFQVNLPKERKKQILPEFLQKIAVYILCFCYSLNTFVIVHWLSRIATKTGFIIGSHSFQYAKKKKKNRCKTEIKH